MNNSIPKKNQKNDWRLFITLIPYVGKNRRILFISLILLFPLAIAGAIQPLIIGQAVSLLQGEPTWKILQNQTTAS